MIKGLFRDFQNLGIRVIPYKGILFSNTIFDNKVIRESGDMDLLVYPEDARKGSWNFFFENGFNFDLFNDEFKFSDQDEIITAILASKGKYEQAFNKNGLHIDLHWG
ncbi:MAG: nucleotidyltransferase family protein [Cytophagaceae bacterium]|nr:nucleotidyltransferase family protein [Cytophagaceae bacterium]